MVVLIGLFACDCNQLIVRLKRRHRLDSCKSYTVSLQWRIFAVILVRPEVDQGVLFGICDCTSE